MSDFKEYLYAKLVLSKLVCQFYDFELSEDKVKELGISYSEDDIFNSLNYVTFVYHNYKAEGLYLWKVLDLKKPIMPISEMWDFISNIAYEKYNESINYEEEATRLKLVVMHMIKKYYKYYMSIDDIKKNNITYDEDIDVLNSKVEGMDHMCEGAGESAWRLFGFEKNFVPLSQALNVQDKLQEKMLKKVK